MAESGLFGRVQLSVKEKSGKTQDMNSDLLAFPFATRAERNKLRPPVELSYGAILKGPYSAVSAKIPRSAVKLLQLDDSGLLARQTGLQTLRFVHI